MFSVTFGEAVLSLGSQTHGIPMTLFAENRGRLLQRLHANRSIPVDSVFLLQGGDLIHFYETDLQRAFIQESFFFWTFGILEPGCYGLVEIKTGKVYLFMPHQTVMEDAWLGKGMSFEEIAKKYEIENIYYANKLLEVLAQLKPGCVLLLKGVNSNSGLSTAPYKIEGLNFFNLNETVLYNELSDCRSIKSQKEIEVMRYVCRISSNGHKQVMKYVKVGVYEYQCESLFLDHIFRFGGCRFPGYRPTCCSGPNCAVVRYGLRSNDRQIHIGDMCIFDMGARYFGFTAMLASSVPVLGKFSPDQALVYNIVYETHQILIQTAKPNTSFPSLFRLTNRILLTRFTEAGLLMGNVEDMIELGLIEFFMPHSVAHLIGLDLHDVGGFLPQHPPRSREFGLRFLRTNRIIQTGMTIALVVGWYFNESLLMELQENLDLVKFVNLDKLKRLKPVAGVRIIDVAVINETGAEVLTSVPRSISDIEKFMLSHPKQKSKDPIY